MKKWSKEMDAAVPVATGLFGISNEVVKLASVLDHCASASPTVR